MTLEELQKDEEFKKQIEDAQSFEEVAEIFKSRGVDVTVEQLKNSIEENKDGELGEEELEDVAGGSIIGLWPRFPRIPTIWPPIIRWPRKRW